MDNDYILEYVERDKDDLDFYPVDFVVRDAHDEPLAWVWGSKEGGVEVECSHKPRFTDEDERGWCPICGATCDWHYESVDEDGQLLKERVISEWYVSDKDLAKEDTVISKTLEEQYGITY